MSKRDFRLYCTDILESGNAILEYIKSLSYEELQGDRKTYSAVIRELSGLLLTQHSLSSNLNFQRSGRFFKIHRWK